MKRRSCSAGGFYIKSWYHRMKTRNEVSEYSY
jgi:hypothetical protein